MTITIELPDESKQKLAELAASKGYADVTAYVQALIDRSLAEESESQSLHEEFQRLADQWREETKYLSIAKRMAEHPAHQKIVAMGERAVPLILAEMERRPGHWFIALRTLTGANPIPEESRGKLQEMTEAWLKWGREQGYQW